ncbi:hypothetical protein A8C32_07360 [Flavivirga aquatica]|uniref:Transporter n=1 Tax=Flavivirga aquatica TaxID=1849968 RepID=A0A1E5SIP9_9FLAO|nr:transporter [Flavivirga aquatica]OEJ98992.1 hypothetical protein A8C32_07360 [Flavivirga aquatica]
MSKKYKKIIAKVFFLVSAIVYSQSPVSGFYAKKNELSIASGYSFKSYNKFYRGTTLSDNTPANLGKITSSIVNLYGEYGISDWLSTVASVPYISIKSETGVDPIQNKNLVEGVQDLGVTLKAKAYEKTLKGASKLTLGASAGINIPISDYEASGVLSIGNRATTIDFIAIAHYTSPFNVFAELQTGYSDRNSSDFEIPNAALHIVKIGYFNDWIYVHTKLGIQNSLSGLDIGTPEFAKAGGPNALPETEVDYTSLSFDLYTPVYKKTIGLSLGFATTLNGRNFNAESGFSLSLVYKS